MIAQLDKRYIRSRPFKALQRIITYTFFEGRPLTTRGRWINPVVFSLMAVEKQIPQLRRVKQPVFILGTGRSGSTILGKLFSYHRDAGFLNEPKALWHSFYPMEDVIGNFTRRGAQYRLEAGDMTTATARHARRLYGFYLLVTGARRVVDKSDHLIFRVPFIRAVFPDAKFIFLLRNGYDTCVSVTRWSEKNTVTRGNERQDWWGRNDRKWHLLREQVICGDPAFADIAGMTGPGISGMDKAAVEWVATMKEGFDLMQKFPGDIMPVRYEDLVREPMHTMKKLFRFCEFSHDAGAIAYARNAMSPVPPRDPPKLHPLLTPLFDEMMGKAGYTVNRSKSAISLP